MRNRITTFLAMGIIAIAYSAGSARVAADLIANGGFELGTGADADNWSQFEGATPPALASVDRVNMMQATGDWAMELSVTGSTLSVGTNAEIQQLTALNSITPGASYDMSFLAKAANIGPGVVVFMEVQWLDSDGSDGGGVKGSSGLVQFAGSLTNVYQLFGFTGIVAAPGSDAAQVDIRMNGGAFDGSDGLIYIDDVTLTPEPGSLALLAIGGMALLRRRR
ncbi:MAG: PEP-CTERM sorting domain-containing protein [Phycisphaerales bacterium]|nr:PEP-CTERM sorting domain-containing protein [Phycisphaerales bacterium]MCB9854724.1 PEP-CTERM sorting domain-containing protein [Phycisphaerales bacterium]